MVRGRGTLAPMTARTEQRYRDRVSRVVDAIARDPLTDHSLEALAAIAHFSPFHFHRVYQGVTGETVAATVRRVRLALATRLLQQGDGSVTEVAMACGYDSPQAFTRAFGLFTGLSPRAFQRQVRSPWCEPAAASAPTGGLAQVEVRIVERPALRVHALRHDGPFSTIPHTHRRLRLHAGDRPISEWLGISHGDPAAAGDFIYHAAAAVPEPWPDAPGLETLALPAGRYACHTLAGPYSQINATLAAIHARWLPSSGHEPDDRPTLECYLNSPRTVTSPAALRTELLIPIRSFD